MSPSVDPARAERENTIQLLCGPCNRKKYNKDPFIFAQEQGRLL